MYLSALLLSIQVTRKHDKPTSEQNVRNEEQETTKRPMGSHSEAEKLTMEVNIMTSNPELWFFVAAVISLNKSLNKRSICRWFEFPLHLCDVTVMITKWYKEALHSDLVTKSPIYILEWRYDDWALPKPVG